MSPAKRRWLVWGGALVLLLAAAVIAALQVRMRFVKAVKTLAIQSSQETAGLRESLNEGLSKIRSDIAGVASEGRQDAHQRAAIESLQRNITAIRQELKQVRQQLAAVGRSSPTPTGQVDRAWAPPEGSERATLRSLPYPFSRYFSIASDVDSLTFAKAESIYDTLKLVALPLSDSAHLEGGPKAVPGGVKVNDPGQPEADRKVATVDVMTGDKLLENLLARWFQQGLIDTHHGLFSGYFLYAKDFAGLTLKPADPVGSTVKDRVALTRYFPFESSTPTESAPLELLIRYEMPMFGALTLRLVDGDGKVLWTSGARMLPARVAPTTISIPMEKLAGEALRVAPKLALEMEFTSHFKGAYLKVDAVGALDRTRTRVEEGMRRAEALNITMPIFSRHGMPPGGSIGVSDLHAVPEVTTWADTLQGDNPQSPIYWIDLLDRHGTEFIGRDTSVLDKAFDIKDLTYPYLFYDGKRRHSFHRIFSSRRMDAASSHEAAIGDQIAGSLATIDAAPVGSGGQLYTHWGVALSKEKFAAVGGVWPLSQPTLDAFALVAGRYYGWRDGKPVPASQRLWVAPSYRQLVYSVMRRQIEPNVSIDADKNTVYVRRWLDPVTDRELPGRDLPLKRLQGITVYVASSQAARAFVEDQEVFSFTRNPRDETGRESITFVDNSTPTLVFDEVDLQHRPGKVVQRNARMFPTATDAFSGQRAMDVVTQGNNGYVEWQPEALSCVQTDSFQFAVRKSDPSMRVGIVLTDDKDQTWEYIEPGIEPATATSVVQRFEAAKAGGWSLQTFAFTNQDFSRAGKMQVPWGKLKSVRFLAGGTSGQTATFDRVACLRQNPLDDPSGGFRISGRLSFVDLEMKPTKVVMEVNGARYETTSGPAGVYSFDELVPRDALVMVQAIGGPNNDGYAPDQGRLLQVTGNIADLDITLARDQHPPDLKGTVPPATIATGQFLGGVGFHYRPGSRFSSTGLSNPTEYRSELVLNNLGYVDREQRAQRMSPRAKRIMILGACNLWGHTEGLYFNTASVLEDILRVRKDEPYEVMNLSTASQHAGVSWFFYDKLGRDYKPDVVFYELVGPLDVGLSHPRYASIYNMTQKDHLPSSTFRPDGKGGLETQLADPNFANFKITDPDVVARRNKELAENAYIIDGINFMYLFHRDPAVPFNEREAEIESYYGKLIKEVKQRFEADGVRVVFIVTDHFGQAYVPPTMDGVAYNRRNFDARMNKLCTEAGAECTPFVPRMEERFSDLTMRHWRRDSHYSRVGYRWFAEAIADYLDRK